MELRELRNFTRHDGAFSRAQEEIQPLPFKSIRSRRYMQKNEKIAPLLLAIASRASTSLGQPLAAAIEAFPLRASSLSVASFDFIWLQGL